MKFPVKCALSVAVGITLSFAASSVRAEPQKIDFDQGVDATRVLKSIPRETTFIYIDTNTLTSIEEVGIIKLGPVSGIDTTDRVQNSAPYTAALEYPPLIEVLEPADRDPLRAEWRSINTERTRLLSEANALESEDRKLYERGVAIDQNAERLNLRQGKLSTEIDNFNRQCTGRPLPPDEYKTCVRWETDLRRRLDAHNAEVVQHNKTVDQWRIEAADLRTRVGTTNHGLKQNPKPGSFLGRVAAWEQQKIYLFIDRASAAVRRRNVSTIRLQAQQGHVVDASEAFSKPGLITLSECRAADDRLWAKLTPAQKAVRANARVAMREWMRNAAAGGGSGPTPQIPFYDKYPHDDDDPRFDLQVIRGRACVPDDCCSK